jgi:hypothetical protein
MRKRNLVEKTIKAEIVENIKCDICGKEIDGKFWILTTSHEDWGNDSVDSVEYFDICSTECINKALNDYIERCEYSYTQRFELEQDLFSAESGDKDVDGAII